MSRPLSIGVVCFPSVGGSGVMASELAMGLAQRGHRIHLFATRRPSRVSGDDVRFHQVEVPDYPLFEHAPYTVALASKIVDVARVEHLDVLHVHYAVPHAASGLLVRSALGPEAPKLVTSLHGTDVTGIGTNPSYRSMTAAAIAQSDGVTVPSDFLRREARARFGMPEGLAIEVMPNFVDTDHFTPAPRPDRTLLHGLFPGAAPNDPILFHASNFRAVKRTADLIDILAEVRRHLPARLVLVGDGPERPLAEERARTLGLADSVCFLGKRCEFIEHLRHADAFLLSSQSESFGVAALEALSAGVPVFAYRVGGLPEVIVPEVGALVEPFDVRALASAVVQTLTVPGRREAMGRAARVHATEHFHRAPAIGRFETYLSRLLEPRG